MLLPAAAKVVQFVLGGRKKCKKIIIMDLQLCWCLPDEIAHEKGCLMEIFLLSAFFCGVCQAEPLLKPPSVESSLTDILLQRNTSQSRSFEYGLVELAILPLKFYTAAHLLLNFIQLLSQSQLVDTVILQQRSEQKFRV